MTKEIKPFDPSKPVETRRGKPARILCVDAKGALYPIVALVEERPGEEAVRRFTKNGKFLSRYGNSETDLVNAPVRCSGWRRVYTSGVVSEFFWSQESARWGKSCSDDPVFGLLRVDLEDGVVVRIESEKWDDPQTET